MLNQYEVMLSGDKFKNVGSLRDFLMTLDSLKYCAYGSFLSSMLFKRAFSGSFDILVEDEFHVYEVVENLYDIDRKKGLVTLTNKEDGTTLKVRIINVASKHEDIRQYMVENSTAETCFISSNDASLDKIEIKIPKRGVTLVQNLLEFEDDHSMVSAIEKIVWCLANVGVATLLRDVRFMPQELVDQAADLIDDTMVEHANKTVSALHAHGSEQFRNLTSTDLKKFGKPFAALLKA